MLWREPKNHFGDCYFCLNDMTGFNKTNKKKTWKYPNLETAIRPVAHSEELPVSIFTNLPDIEEAQYIYFPDFPDTRFCFFHSNNCFGTEADDFTRKLFNIQKISC